MIGKSLEMIIAGGGRIAYYLARSFISKGYSVTIIDRDRDECRRLSKVLKAVVVHGDASDPQVLGDSRADYADIIISVTPNDHDNLIISQLAERKFDVPRTLALVNDPDNVDVFHKLGIGAYSTTDLVSAVLEQRTDMEEITNLIPLSEGRINITEVVVPKASPIAGKLLTEISLPENALVAAITREDEQIIPRGLTRIEPGDRMILITFPENHGSVIKTITGET
ncbi:MAG: NAD-binding protein [Candidatus Aegiribacteria sp.]